MQITWPWPPVGIFSHDLFTLKDKRKCEHKVVRLVWEFDCLHFAKYISIWPHGIDCKQTWSCWCLKIYHMNRATWLNPLWKCLVVTLEYLTYHWQHISVATLLVGGGGKGRQPKGTSVIHTPVVHTWVVHTPVIHTAVIHTSVIPTPVVHTWVIHTPAIHTPVVHT